MNKVIIVRHGYYRGDDLDDFGRRQMEALGVALKAALNGDSISILSSTALRGEQSSEILSRILGVGFEKHELLWTGPDSPGNGVDLVSAVRLIQSSTTSTVIVVTHLEFSEELPSFIAKEMLGGVSDFPFKETEKGSAWVIDCVAKTCTKLAPKVSF